jgi:hypothetical protein
MGTYPIGIVGESFENDDGSSRQSEIKRGNAGEPVTLERDPENKYDSNCVKVVSVRGVQIGNISRDDGWICERIDRGGVVEARILRVGKGAKGKLGVVICLRTAADDDWLQDEESATSTAHASTGCSVVLLTLGLPIAALIGSGIR